MVAPVVGLAARWALTRAAPWVAGGLGRMFFGSATRTVATGLTADWALNNGNLTTSATTSVAKFVGDKALSFITGGTDSVAGGLMSKFNNVAGTLNKAFGLEEDNIVGKGLAGILGVAVGSYATSNLLSGNFLSTGFVLAIAFAAYKAIEAYTKAEPTGPAPRLETAPIPIGPQ